MSSELIINANFYETRVALVENGQVAEFYVERTSDRGIGGNIYKGRVVRVLPGMQAAFVDISERKMAQEALRTSEVNYRNLFENTLMGMEVVDAETMKVVLANHSMARMFGFKSPEDMVGTEPLAYVLPEDLDWVVRELTKALAEPTMHEVATL